MFKKVFDISTGETKQVPFTQEEQEEFDRDKQLAEIEISKTQYQRLRSAEYPPVTDYLDGIVKNDQNQIQKYIDDCLAVKSKYPKT